MLANYQFLHDHKIAYLQLFFADSFKKCCLLLLDIQVKKAQALTQNQLLKKNLSWMMYKCFWRNEKWNDNDVIKKWFEMTMTLLLMKSQITMTQSHI